MADGLSSGSSDEEQLRQQQAAAAAKEAAAAKPKAEVPAANPLLAPSFQTTLQETPYGTVEGKIPAAITNPNQPGGNLPLPYTPNPFTAPQGALDANLATPQGQAAEAYRNLPDNATPEQRANAMEAYRGALGTPAERDFARVQGQREDRMAALAAQGLGATATPEARAAKIAEFRANWRTLTPEEQGAAYFGEKGKNWQATAQPVLSLNQESTINSEVATALKADRNLSAAIRDAKAEGVDEKGRKTKGDKVLAAKLEDKRDQLRIDTGLVNPADREAGLDPDYAKQVARDKFVRGGQSLLDVAKSQRVAEERAKPERGREGPSEQTRQVLAEQEQRRLEHEAWLEQLRQRTATYYYA